MSVFESLEFIDVATPPRMYNQGYGNYRSDALIFIIDPMFASLDPNVGNYHDLAQHGYLWQTPSKRWWGWLRTWPVEEVLAYAILPKRQDILRALGVTDRQLREILRGCS